MFRNLAVAPALSALVVLSLVAGTCWAQPERWPTKPIRYIVVFPPGGTTDIIGRIVSEQLSKALGQPVVVENRPGGGGAVGSEFGAKQPADGYTLVAGTISSLAINVSLYTKLGYDPVRDFHPITVFGSLPNVLVVNPALPVKTVSDLIALAKKRPGELTFASAGSGTSQHLTGELFSMQTGVKMVHVPFKGGAPAIADLVGGHVALAFANLPEALSFIRQGKLRAIAVTTATRASQLPEIPTIAESGLPGFDVTSWQGLVVPTGVPAPIVRRLNEEVVRILRTPEIREKFAGLGIEVVGNSPEEFAAFMKAEIARWAKVVKASGARVD
jgi:tripartite-type tricarboxylate transporter receptor subunit TctC